jgi:hypothetical protein
MHHAYFSDDIEKWKVLSRNMQLIHLKVDHQLTAHNKQTNCCMYIYL